MCLKQPIAFPTTLCSTRHQHTLQHTYKQLVMCAHRQVCTAVSVRHTHACGWRRGGGKSSSVSLYAPKIIVPVKMGEGGRGRGRRDTLVRLLYAMLWGT